MGRKKKAVYTGLFLTEESRAVLEEMTKEQCGALLPHAKCHHLTLKFKPTPEEVLALPIGQEMTLAVAGIVSDESARKRLSAGCRRSSPAPTSTLTSPSPAVTTRRPASPGRPR